MQLEAGGSDSVYGVCVNSNTNAPSGFVLYPKVVIVLKNFTGVLFL